MSARKSTPSQKRRPPKAGVASRLAKPMPAEIDAAKRKFEDGILKRGEAAPEGEPLARGATHAVVGKDAKGKPILKRKRFSAF